MASCWRNALLAICFALVVQFSTAFKADILSGGPTDKNREVITNMGVKRSIYKYFLARDAARAAGLGVVVATSSYDGKPADSKTLYDIFKQFNPPSVFANNLAKFQDAMKVINRENIALSTSQTLAYRSSYHFYSEDIAGGNRRLVRLKSLIDDDIINEKWQESWEQVGRYLHTLQEFYSSTNWVELYGTSRGTNRNLGKAGASIGVIASPGDPTCYPCASSDGACPNNLHGFVKANNILTSGYHYWATDDSGNRIPKPVSPPGAPGKCSHGGLTDPSRKDSPIGGINKESRNSYQSPHNDSHEQAAELAIQATEEFFDDIFTGLGEPSYLGFLNQRYAKSLAIVIDDTASMREEIDASKALARGIIDDNAGQDVNFVLVRFNDPEAELLASTTDDVVVKGYLDALQPHGGDDCPEMSLGGIIKAAEELYPDSSMYVFTDAPPKDTSRQAEMFSLLTSKNIKPTFVITALCGSKRRKRQAANNIYQILAQQLGGSYIETTNTDVADAVNIIRNQIRNLAAASLLEVELPSGTSTSHTFDVDRSVKNLTITLTSAGGVSITSLRNSGGAPVTADANTDLSNNKEWEVWSPAPGTWNIDISCSRTCSLSIKGLTDATFTYDLRVPGTDPAGAETFEALVSKPPQGSRMAILVELVGNYTQLGSLDKVQYLALDGWEFDFCRPSALGSNLEYSCLNLTTPNDKFRVAIVGTAKTGERFQRVSPEIITPTFLDVQANSTTIEVAQGDTVNFDIVLKSNSDRLLDVSFNNQKDLSVTTSNSVRVTSGEGVLSVAVTAAPATIGSSSRSIRFSFEDSTDPAINNYILIRFILVSKVPVAIADTNSPKCQVVWDDAGILCKGLTDPSVCSSHRWSGNISLSDDKNLSSISYIPNVPGINITTDVPTLTGQLSANAIVLADCCESFIRLEVSDLAGNTETCEIGSPNLGIFETTTTSTTTTSTTTTSTTTTMKPFVPPNECRGGPGTLYTADGSTECAHYTQNGYRLSCPAGLAFDIGTCSCSWPSMLIYCDGRLFDINRFFGKSPTFTGP